MRTIFSALILFKSYNGYHGIHFVEFLVSNTILQEKGKINKGIKGLRNKRAKGQIETNLQVYNQYIKKNFGEYFTISTSISV